jgi:uncharacterized membrane protein
MISRCRKHFEFQWYDKFTAVLNQQKQICVHEGSIWNIQGVLILNIIPLNPKE